MLSRVPPYSSPEQVPSKKGMCDDEQPSTVFPTSTKNYAAAASTSTSLIAIVSATVAGIGAVLLLIMFVFLRKAKKRRIFGSKQVAWPYQDACDAAATEMMTRYDSIYTQACHEHGLVKQQGSLPVFDRCVCMCVDDLQSAEHDLMCLEQTQLYTWRVGWRRKLWKSVSGDCSSFACFSLRYYIFPIYFASSSFSPFTS